MLRCWRELKAEGLEVRSLAEGLPEIDSRFVVVVGDRGLAERVRVVYLNEDLSRASSA